VFDVSFMCVSPTISDCAEYYILRICLIIFRATFLLELAVHDVTLIFHKHFHIITYEVVEHNMK